MNPSHSDSAQGTAFPDLSVDYFTLMGLEHSTQIDRDRLEQNYLELSSRYHPDRFAQGSTSVRRRAMETSTALNQAYRVLRDPGSRAEYLCKLGGIDLDSSDPEHGAPKMEQGFLMEMIERRERLEQARGQGDQALEALRQAVEDELEDTLDRALGLLESEDAASTRQAARELVVRRYLQRLIDEIDEAPSV